MKKFLSLCLALILVLGAFIVLSLSAAAASPGLSVVLSAGGGVFSAGDTVTFNCSVTNVGDVTVSELSAYDTLGVTSQSLGALYPGESTSFSFSYTVTALDESAGSVYCSVSAMGMVPGGASYSDSSNTVVVSTGAPQPDASASVTVSVGVPENGSSFVAGEKVYCNAEIVNTGYVDLNNVAVKDSLNSHTDNIGTIPIGDYVNNGFIYTVTDADIGSGTLQCFCVLTATLPDGSDYGTMSNTVVIPLSSDSAKTAPITSADTDAATENTAEDKTEATAATSATAATAAPTSASTAPTDAKDQQAQSALSFLSIFGNIYIIIAIISVVVITAAVVVIVLLLKKKKKK